MTKKKVSKKTKKKTVNKKVKAVNGTPSKDIFSSPINEIGPYKAKRGEARMVPGDVPAGPQASMV